MSSYIVYHYTGKIITAGEFSNAERQDGEKDHNWRFQRTSAREAHETYLKMIHSKNINDAFYNCPHEKEITQTPKQRKQRDLEQWHLKKSLNKEKKDRGGNLYNTYRGANHEG